MSIQESSLYVSIARSVGLRPPYLQDIYTTTLSPIMVILSWIPSFPILVRKAILDACRIQAPVLNNQSLQHTFASLPQQFVGYVAGQLATLTLSAVISLLDQITPFPLLCCLLSYFVRAESTFHIEEFLLERQKGLDKELRAALFNESTDQVLDYRFSLFGIGSNNLHPQMNEQFRDGSHRLRALYEKGIRQIAQHFSRHTTPPLLPRYNARKNISYSTIRAYYEAVGPDSPASLELDTNVTTLDLLRWYYISGDQILGPIEMRLAWFYNDLKPRIYYCLGGTDFWHGTFIQDLANMFCEILPSTNPFSRFSVSRVGDLSYDDLLITYDYSSFTTSLAELRYFLHWLARVCGDVTVQVLDVRHGVQTHKLSDILDEYNAAVNIDQIFSVERFSEGEASYELRQGRSGSLGVKGNIVFSTTLHGLALADITGTPDDDCCVGDDALARIRAWLLTIFIRCVNNLGEINPDKFTTIKRPQEAESVTTTQYKFLKRPLFVDTEGHPVVGRLDFFPSIADAIRPEGDGIHTARPGTSPYMRAKTFAMQVGRFLTMQVQAPCIVARDQDLDFILESFRMVYRRLGLPVEGGIPGDFDVADVKLARFFCPPVDDTDVFSTHWMEILLHRLHGHWTTLPVTVGGCIPPPLNIVEGETFKASSDVSFLQLCVDLRLLDKEVETRWVQFDWEVLETVMDRLYSRLDQVDVEPLLCTYTVLSPPPTWWYDMCSYYYPDLMQEDPQEAWERISTIMSGSVI